MYGVLCLGGRLFFWSYPWIQWNHTLKKTQKNVLFTQICWIHCKLCSTTARPVVAQLWLTENSFSKNRSEQIAFIIFIFTIDPIAPRVIVNYFFKATSPQPHVHTAVTGGHLHLTTNQVAGREEVKGYDISVLAIDMYSPRQRTPSCKHKAKLWNKVDLE